MRPDTSLACHRLRADTPPEGTDLYKSLVYPHLGKVKLFRMESLGGDQTMQIDEQLRASCEGPRGVCSSICSEWCVSMYPKLWMLLRHPVAMFRSASLSRGFRRLFHPAALGRWWHANPSAVTEAVTTLAKHAQQSGELWQLTFDVMLLCFTCIHDTDFQAQCAEQVLTWLAMDCLSDADYFYGCRCMVYCQPFSHLYDMHSSVLQRIIHSTRRAEQGMRCYTRWTAQTALHMWKLGSTWWAFYVFDHIDAAVEDSIMKNVWNWCECYD